MRLHRSLALNLIAAIVFLLSVAIFVNGTFFSVAGSRQIDFSINYTAGRVLHEGGDIYNRETLRAQAEKSDTVTIPTVYEELFATYIQPPTTAFVTYFFAFFDYRTARLLWLVFTHLLFAAAFLLVISTIPRESRTPLYLAACAALIANYGAIYMSLSLGQVDGLVVFSIALALWAWKRKLFYLVGVAITVAAAFKIVPAILLLYFLWQRAYRVVAGAVATGIGIVALTAVVLGPASIVGYVLHVVPLLLKGSVHHQNVTISAFVNRLYLDKEWLSSLSEIPNNGTARAIGLVASIVLVGVVTYVTRPDRKSPAQYEKELALVMAASILLSSIAWEFYLTWLMPFFLLLIHPRNWPSTRLAIATYLTALFVSYVGMNVPIGFISEPNSIFYHPDLSPGVFLESQYLHFYSDIDRQIFIPIMRFSGLLLFAGTLVVRLLNDRRPQPAPQSARPGPLEGAPVSQT